MADGRIKIEIEVDGKQVSLASKELDNLEKTSLESSKGVKAAERAMDNISESSAEASKSVKGVSNSLDEVSGEASEAASDLNKAKNETKGVGDESDKASNKTKKFAIAIGLIAIASAAFGVLKSSMDAAISRFDTLNKFPKVLQALGVSAEDSERAMTRLSDGIDGLPTKLDEIASTAQRMYTSFNDMDKATDSALALNNALLAQGSSAADAQRGTEQYLKALQTGKMEMDTWNTLSETMDVGLVKIAESFGFAGGSLKQDLYNALKDGTITMSQFNDKLIELGTGTGELAKLAKVNSLGIATSLGNLRNAAARGMAGIIDSFNKLSKQATGKEIAENIDSLKVIVNQSFKVMQNVIEGTTPYVKGFASAVNATLPVIRFLSPALIGLATAYGMHKVIHVTTTAIKANTTATAIGTAVKKAYILAMTESTTGYLANAAATNISALATKARTAWLVTATQAELLLTRQITLGTIAKSAAATATTVLGTAIKVLMGPVGWVTLAIGALVGAVIGIVKWLNRSSAEAKKLKAETEELGKTTDTLTDNLNSTSKAYKENEKDIKASAKANSELAKKIEELASKENKSAAEKALLQSHIESLNGSVEGLNLAYDEEANALNMSSKELQARINLMKEQEVAQEAQSRLIEIMKEQELIEDQLAETIAKRKEAEDNSNLSKKDAKKITEELTEQEKILKEALNELGEQYGITEEQIATAKENATAAIVEGNIRQIESYEDLEDVHKNVFDSMKATYDELKDAATDAFDKIETKTDHTMDSMTETLLHNQKVVAEWGENQAKLMEWAGENGYDNFIPYIENMGIDSAAELAVLAKAGEEELSKFADAIENGAEVAGTGFKTSLGNEFDDAVDIMMEFVDKGAKSLREQIKKSGFEDIGIAMPEGVVIGVEKGTPDVEKASAEMADKSIRATKATLESNSPSKVFKGIGGDITDGMVLGLNNGTSKVIQAITKLNKSIIDPFKNTKSQFNSIGKDAMAGLNQGLIAGRAQVLSTARNIANSVASTMKNALKIHSPSRLMRDDVGKWIPEGIALGIKENAKTVYRELDSLSKNMIVTSSPEQALGTSKMAYASSGSQFVEAIKNNITTPFSGNSNNHPTVNKQPANITFILGGREFEVFVDDITTVQDRKSYRLKAFREG